MEKLGILLLVLLVCDVGSIPHPAYEPIPQPNSLLQNKRGGGVVPGTAGATGVPVGDTSPTSTPPSGSASPTTQVSPSSQSPTTAAAPTSKPPTSQAQAQTTVPTLTPAPTT